LKPPLILDEQGVPFVGRVSIGFNANANDVKIRNNRTRKFKHFGVLVFWRRLAI
jgi:hypothetical protein